MKIFSDAPVVIESDLLVLYSKYKLIEITERLGRFKGACGYVCMDISPIENEAKDNDIEHSYS